MKNIRKTVLDTAEKAVNGSRNLNHGEPEQNFARIARLWNAHGINAGLLDATDASKQLTEADVALMLAMVKVARIENKPSHLESWVDIAGYAACGAEVAGAK